MKHLFASLSLLTLAALVATPAAAGTIEMSAGKAVMLPPPPPPYHGFTLRVGGDVEFPVAREFHTGPGTIDSKNWDDIYDVLYGGSLEFGYDFGNRFSAYLGVGYIQGSADSLSVGAIGGFPAFAEFGDYEAWRVSAGVRYNLAEGQRFTPYVGAFVGASFTNGIDANLSVPGAALSAPGTPFYDDSTVIFTGATIGVSFEINPSFLVGVESGFTYSGSLDEDDSGLTGLGLATLNDGEGLFTIPVRIYGQVRF